MKSIKIITILGARPQFVKAAAVSRGVAEFSRKETPITLNECIVHTGRHYDENMSKVFFDQFHIPRPDVNLKVGSGLHGQQTGAMLEKLETVLTETKPDWVLITRAPQATLDYHLTLKYITRVNFRETLVVHNKHWATLWGVS